MLIISVGQTNRTATTVGKRCNNVQLVVLTVQELSARLFFTRAITGKT